MTQNATLQLLIGLLIGAGAVLIFIAPPEQPASTSDTMGTMETPTMHDVAMTDHMHTETAVSEENPIPTITLDVMKDAKDGYNVYIITEHFTFTPELANEEPVFNEGHAHLYINGIKIGRLYGAWTHIPSSLLVTGTNTIEVTLNANNHSDWIYDGVHIGEIVEVLK